MTNTQPIRILHVTGAMNRGGAETMLMDIYRHLDRESFQFDFLINVKKAQPHPAGDFDEEIRALGGRLSYITAQGENGLIGYIRDFRRIVEEQGGYDIIHAHMDTRNGVIALAARRAGQRAVIAHSHSSALTGGHGLLNRLLCPVQKLLIHRYATHHWACSRLAGGFLFPRQDYVVIHNAVDTQAFTGVDAETAARVRREIGAGKQTLVISNIASVSETKNQRFFVEIGTRLQQAGSDFIILLVGRAEGAYADALREQLASAGLTERVRLLGLRTDIPALLAASDLFVMPSIFEGLPVASIEAQAAGVPCLFSTGITRELDMELGLTTFLPLDNAQLWVDAIQLAGRREPLEAGVIVGKIARHGYDARENTRTVARLYREMVAVEGSD
jgi:glycosyltransferase EpsF